MNSQRFKDAVALAVEAANRSKCKKSQRGAVLFYPGQESRGVMGTAHNALVQGHCNGTRDCREACAKRCEHAEAAVIRLVATRSQQYWPGIHLLHAKTVDGVLVPSGPPSCWQCSKMIATWGVGFVWLYHADSYKCAAWTKYRWRKYTGSEFHRLTLEHAGLA